MRLNKTVNYASSNFSEDFSIVLNLPLEIILYIIASMPLKSMLRLARTSKQMHQLVSKEILSISQETYKKLQAQYTDGPSLIQHNLALLKPKYQYLHPHYDAYRTLQALSSKDCIKSVLENENIDLKKAFLCYPEFYQSHLPSGNNIDCHVAAVEFLSGILSSKKSLLIHEWPIASVHTTLDVISNIKPSPLQLKQYFIGQVIASDYIEQKQYITSLELIKKHKYKYDSEYIVDYLTYHSANFSTEDAFKKAFEDLYGAYSLIKALLQNCENKAERDQLFQYIKTQAQIKIDSQVPLHFSIGVQYILPFIIAIIAHYVFKLNDSDHKPRLSP